MIKVLFYPKLQWNLLEFSSKVFLKSITAIDSIVTPEYCANVERQYPMFVTGYKSPSPAVDMVIKVSQSEFSKDRRIGLLRYSAILMEFEHKSHQRTKDIEIVNAEFYLNQHFRA